MPKPGKKTPQPEAVHLAKRKEDGSISHVVGFGNLRVVIVKESTESWFAQGIDLDYAAQGRSLEEAKKNFEAGLRGTVSLHLRAHGTIEGLLRVAPENAWKSFYSSALHARFSQISSHSLSGLSLPFGELEFLAQERPSA